MSSPTSLSKSLVLKGLQCPKSLWLSKFQPGLADPVSPSLQAVFDQGKEVGEWSRKYYPDGHLIAEDHLHKQEALSSTREALTQGKRLLYEPAFVHDEVLVRLDILRVIAGDELEFIEVKSSTEPKDVYRQDVAIQYHVLAGCGFRVRRAFLMLINNQYIRDGDIEPGKLFRMEDVTGEVVDSQSLIADHIAELKKVLALRKPPDIDIGPRCGKPYDCSFMEHCWSAIPDYSVYDIPHIRDKAEQLRRLGILRIQDIPRNFHLTPRQKRYVFVEKQGVPEIDREALRELIGTLRYPLHFLDFETISPAVPPYDGLRPFQQTPFQFSLRKWDRQREVEHVEFLGDGKTDPRANVARMLAEHIEPEGSVIVYNASFESSVLGQLAQAFPAHRKKLLSTQERLWDLRIPFQDQLYIHPGFRCSSSLKAVLPALIPSMSYDSLAIADGGAASQAYLLLMSQTLPAPEEQKIRDQLKTYCGQDTLATVRILEHLRGL